MWQECPEYVGIRVPVAPGASCRDDGGMRISVARRGLVVAGLVLSAGTTPIRAQDATWYLRGNDAAVQLVGPRALVLRGRTPAPVATSAGDWRVHFGADAAGQPGALSLAVPEAAQVMLAIAPAVAVAVQEIAFDDPRWIAANGGDAAAPWRARRCAADLGAEYRVTARGVGTGAQGAFGVVARFVDERQHYRFVWDLQQAELRLERQLGDAAYVLAKRPAPPPDDQPHTLALQVEGFRVMAFCDDAPVVQVLDGAIGRGDPGVWQQGEAVTWQSFAVQAPAAPRASSALVVTGRVAHYQAATAVAAGHWYAVSWSLDRPTPAVPLTSEGCELWLLQRSALPQVLLADWRGSLGPGTLGEVPRDGRIEAELLVPDLLALRLQSLLVRAEVWSADGGQRVGATPATPWWL